MISDEQDHLYQVKVILVAPISRITAVGELSITGEIPYLTLGVDQCDDPSLWQLRKE